MTVRASVSARLNYTGRKKIPLGSQTIVVKIRERKPESVDIEISFDYEEILKAAKVDADTKTSLVLDAYYRGSLTRFVLARNSNSQLETILDCPDQVNPTFRLKLVSNQEHEQGKVLASSIIFSAREEFAGNDGDPERNNFFKLERSDSLDGQLWTVSWQDNENPRISVNGKLFDKGYTDQSKELRAFLLPEIVKEMCFGLLFRAESIPDIPENCSLYRWLQFFEQRLGVDFSDVNDETSDLDKFLLIQEALVEFTHKKWSKDKRLIDELIGA